MKFKTIILFVLAVVFLIFLFQNTNIVQVKFLFWELKTSGIFFFLVTLFIGIAIGYISAKIGKKKNNK
jgi:uncharacterized integral membrane protein